MFKNILCAMDGSDHSRRALALAIDLASKYEAQLTLVHALLRNADASALNRFATIEGLVEHVQPELRRLEGMKAHLEIGSGYDDRAVAVRVLVEVGQSILNEAKMDARDGGVHRVETMLVDGDPADQILDCIQARDIDCVVLGCRGLSEVKALVLGSVSHKVANRSPCTCIAVK